MTRDKFEMQIGQKKEWAEYRSGNGKNPKKLLNFQGGS